MWCISAFWLMEGWKMVDVWLRGRRDAAKMLTLHLHLGLSYLSGISVMCNLN